MHNYHYIKTPQGIFRLKIPIAGHIGDKINTIRSKDELGWKAKHLKTLVANYKRAKFFDEIYSDFACLLNSQYPNIALQNETIIKFYCKKLGINTSFVEASSMSTPTAREEKIIDLCYALKGNIYYSGIGAKVYQREENFAKRGITLEYTAFQPFEYPQLWGSFQHNVTILDYLMNCGYDWEGVLNSQNQNQKRNIGRNEENPDYFTSS